MTRRRQAARERAQRERQERIEQALQHLPELAPTQSISLVAGEQREQNDRRIRGKRLA
ncbi:MAG: hypothetical protein IPP22_04030 [Nitrosomonas sp.]|nr:hypothetical protein [Nitrosomonas sp.]